jgi:arginyl-tRNA synthetase
MHVAKTIWGIINLVKAQTIIPENGSLQEKVAYMGNAYAFGNSSYESEAQIKNEIIEINKAIYRNGNTDLFPDIQKYYEWGKYVSLEYFETIYKKLGTRFDYHIMESEVGERGKEIVKKYLGTVFEESDGALVYKGEKAGLHTRVFVSKEGLPTYEAKELGNTYKKHELIPDATQSIVVTANEIDEYFKVIKSALREIDAPLSDSIIHISHGMLRLPEGKMSSRTGNIIPAEELIDSVKERIGEKMSEMKGEEKNKDQLVNDIAVGAIKFAILKSAPGKDMVFDFEKSLSFEGDSGPYLQYALVRAKSVIKQAEGSVENM